MRFTAPHPWRVSVQEAIAIQEQLRSQVIRRDCLNAIHTVAGVDVGFEDGGNVTRAAVAVLEFPGLHRLASVVMRCPTTFPYVPGLLSFREAPAVLEALSQLSEAPDLLLCDGQGIAHPRRFGIACHLGLVCDLPSVGVAKSRLVGRHAPVGEQRGAWQPLMDAGEQIGVVLRTLPGAPPLYISVGHKISLETAIQYVLQCTEQHRLPEPTRQAHLLASKRD